MLRFRGLGFVVGFGFGFVGHVVKTLKLLECLLLWWWLFFFVFGRLDILSGDELVEWQRVEREVL